LRNRLNDIRHELKIDKQVEFAQIIGITKNDFTRYKNHQREPSSETCQKILLNLKQLRPNITFEDLWESQ
jgi:DNA-binding XRE family transcriptional regulator